jgi:hypothetical protein
MFPYKIQMHQSLTDVDKDRRVAFCGSFRQNLGDNLTVIDHVWFTVEAHFHPKG